MKIGDFEKRGNVIRLYLVDDDCNDYWGDDWDDKPYEYNAGEIYDEFVVGTIDIGYSFKYEVIEPADDYSYSKNSPFCKEDFKTTDAPFAIVRLNPEGWETHNYSDAVIKHDYEWAFHYNDDFELTMKHCRGVVLDMSIKDGIVLDSRIEDRYN